MLLAYRGELAEGSGAYAERRLRRRGRVSRVVDAAEAAAGRWSSLPPLQHCCMRADMATTCARRSSSVRMARWMST